MPPPKSKPASESADQRFKSLLSIVAASVLVLLIEYFLVQPWRDSRAEANRIGALADRWEYLVENSATKLSHAGGCTIKIHEGKITFDGVRMYDCSPPDPTTGKGRTCIQVNFPWHSEWAELCHDDRIRGQYTINTTGATLNGFFNVARDPATPDIMTGHFYYLPPTPKDLPAEQHGSIVFRRLRPGESVREPSAI